VRLRPLTEAECYARCYGGRSEESVALLWVEPRESDHEPAPDPREEKRADAAEGREAA
jgi:hypothetical protein